MHDEPRTSDWARVLVELSLLRDALRKKLEPDEPPPEEPEVTYDDVRHKARRVG